MDKHYNNIKDLIEGNLVEIKKQEISANYHTLITYHNVGREIVLAQSSSRGKTRNDLMLEYSKRLTEEYGKGYDYKNLFRMRQLYLSFPKVATVWRQLNWSIFKLLLPIKIENKRNYYINSTIEHNFSVRQLRDYMNSNAYERLVNKENIQLKYLDNEIAEENSIMNMVKNPILITMSNSVDKFSEKAMKKFILEQIEKIMIELGVGFAFVGSEVPIKIDNKTLRPDLVFFNTELACFVILELKIKELTIKDIGQIEFYIKYYDKHIKKDFYNPTIGITISKKVNENIVTCNEKENIKHSTYELIEK